MASTWRTSCRCYFVKGELWLAGGETHGCSDQRGGPENRLPGSLVARPARGRAVSAATSTPRADHRSGEIAVSSRFGRRDQSLLRLWRPDEVLACWFGWGCARPPRGQSRRQSQLSPRRKHPQPLTSKSASRDPRPMAWPRPSLQAVGRLEQRSGQLHRACASVRFRQGASAFARQAGRAGC